tara:strand:+ start:3235 stop:3357 length:123 start_codon:yes stop_codon:yes gene_type:complete
MSNKEEEIYMYFLDKNMKLVQEQIDYLETIIEDYNTTKEK